MMECLCWGSNDRWGGGRLCGLEEVAGSWTENLLKQTLEGWEGCGNGKGGKVSERHTNMVLKGERKTVRQRETD